ncbi:hypothetical protein HaLaN_11454 [Haematococcus lacustris]|uniref:Uncharacterized protein n=1 Tax=Haematococcus lacustris TaxID=44745 RepID=A0A699Z7S5_HAELA|nr:hypothetical protein HaLaN_11454 [Haematococcus lacustris]
MEDYIELYIALTKSGDKVATFDARGEACFTAKDLAQVLALHGLGDGRSGSRKKRVSDRGSLTRKQTWCPTFVSSLSPFNLLRCRKCWPACRGCNLFLLCLCGCHHQSAALQPSNPHSKLRTVNHASPHFSMARLQHQAPWPPVTCTPLAGVALPASPAPPLPAACSPPQPTPPQGPLPQASCTAPDCWTAAWPTVGSSWRAACRCSWQLAATSRALDS